MMLSDWAAQNDPKSELIYANAARNQFEQFAKLATKLGAEPLVVETHRSKSVTLPVVRFNFINGEVYIRENFYDANLTFLWKFQPELSLADVHCRQLTYAQYLAAYDKWVEWETRAGREPQYTSSDVTWWSDWSCGELFPNTTEFGPDTIFYISDTTFLEGIEKVVPPSAQRGYRLGAKSFSVWRPDITSCEQLIKTVRDAKEYARAQ